jgi:phage-related tail fiber protein
VINRLLAVGAGVGLAVAPLLTWYHVDALHVRGASDTQDLAGRLDHTTLWNAHRGAAIVLCAAALLAALAARVRRASVPALAPFSAVEGG